MASFGSLIKVEPVSPAAAAAGDGHLAAPSGCSTPSYNPVQEIKQEQCNSPLHDRRSTAYECAGCKKIISDRYLLKAVDQFWHEDCLKCSCCDSRLAEQGCSLFQKDNMLLCKKDYLRLYGASGYCSLCSQSIPANEFVMKAADKVFHLDCFKCQQCSYKFDRGDRFSLVDKLLCENCLQDARNNYQEPEMTDSQMVAHHKQQIFQNLVRHTSHIQHQVQPSTTNSRILDLLQSISSAHKTN